MSSIKNKTVSGVKWQVILQITSKAISVITFAVLARILKPEIFGLFALAFVAIDGLSLFKAFGIDAGIIQRKDCPPIAQNTAFFLIQATGIVIFGICFIAAPFAAHFFKNPDVASVSRALGIIFVINGFGKVPSALLNRQMRFRDISVIQLVGAIVNSVVAITLSYFWHNIWSLVLAYIAKTLVMDILSWWRSGFCLKLEFDRKIAKEFFHFGGFLMASGIVTYINENANDVIVGRFLGTTAIGFMVLAENLANVINTHFTYLILRVLFPAYSAIQDDKENLKRAYLKILKFITMITVPFSIGLMVCAQELVMTLYGKKWIEVVPLIWMTAAVQMFASIKSGASPIYLACGRPKYAFHISWMAMLFKVPFTIFLTIKWGVRGTMLADLISTMMLAPIAITLVRQMIHFSLGEFFTALRPAFFCSAIMLAVLLGLKEILPHLSVSLVYHGKNLFQLLVLGISGMTTYGVAYFLIDRPALLEIKQLLIKSKAAAKL